jgi:hypothetical protein
MSRLGKAASWADIRFFLAIFALVVQELGEAWQEIALLAGMILLSMHQGRMEPQPVGLCLLFRYREEFKATGVLRVEERLDAIEKELAEIRIALLVPTEPSICQAEWIVERVAIQQACHSRSQEISLQERFQVGCST